MMSLVNRVGKFIGKFIYGVINYFFGHERPSSEKILGEWVVVAEYSAEKIVTGIHGNEAKIGETTICVEQNTCSGRLRGYHGDVRKVYMDKDEVSDALLYAKRNGFLK